MIRVLLVIASILLLTACSSPAPAPAPLPPKTVVVTQPAPPAPQVIIPPGFTEVLQRLSAVEGKLTMLESALKVFNQNIPESLKGMQAQIDMYANMKYDLQTIKMDLENIRGRLSAIETRLTAAGH